MKVKLLTTAQARNLHIRFTNWFELRPEPLTNGKWYITRATGLLIKKAMIDEVEGNPKFKQRALQIWNFLKGLPTVELDDYPNALYNTIDPDNATPEELAELEEYIARFSELNFENVTQ